MSGDYDPWTSRGPGAPAAKSKAARKAARNVSRAAANGEAFAKSDGGMFSPDETGEGAANTVAAGQLRAFIERVERLVEEKQAIADNIKEVYAEMKGVGFDTKAVRTIVMLRKKDAAERAEEEAILDLYKTALGMA